jgi:hypothetical protein
MMPRHGTPYVEPSSSTDKCSSRPASPGTCGPSSASCCRRRSINLLARFIQLAQGLDIRDGISAHPADRWVQLNGAVQGHGHLARKVMQEENSIANDRREQAIVEALLGGQAQVEMLDAPVILCRQVGTRAHG